MRQKALYAIGTLLLTLGAAYLAAAGYLYVMQRSYVFEPGSTLAFPADEGLDGVEVVTFETADGTQLTGWFAKAAQGLPTVLYFHGNAGSISDRADRFAQVLASGFGLLAVSYRGYPGSDGSPSEAAIFSDALEVFDWLAERTPEIVVHGESLGTSIATYVAAERSVSALILEAPFTAAVDMAAEAYPWIPVSVLMRDPFVTRDYITQVEEPVLILHGTDDAVVPVEHGRRLFEAANEPKALIVVEGAHHSDLWDRGLWEAVLRFLAEQGVTGQPLAVRRIPSLAG